MSRLICSKCLATYPVYMMDQLNGRCRCGNKLRYVDDWSDDLLIEEKEDVVIDDKIRMHIGADCVLLFLMAFFWILTPMFNGLNYMIGLLFMACAVIIIFFSQNYNDKNHYLELLYYSGAIVGILAIIMCVILILWALTVFDPNFILSFDDHYYNPFNVEIFPPIFHPFAMGFLSIFISIYMFINGRQIR